MQSAGQSIMELPLQEASSSVSSYLDLRGVKVHYRTGGAGEQVLLLHGWGGSIESMGLVFDTLAKSYRVFAMDFPGHGKSDLPPKTWGIADYTECLLQVMDSLGVQRPHIIAHSFGGRVTIRLAMFHADRVNKIILVDSAGIRPQRPPKYHLKIALSRIGKFLGKYGGRIGQTIRKSIYDRIGSKDYNSAGPLRDTFVRVVNEDQTDMLQHIKSPTLLVWGADDKDTPLTSAEKMQKLIPNASLVVIENAGHFSYIDNPHKFHLIVKKFLRDKRIGLANR
jgi:pimeloyl-ACP methyl ester carboxylesterase